MQSVQLFMSPLLVVRTTTMMMMMMMVMISHICCWYSLPSLSTVSVSVVSSAVPSVVDGLGWERNLGKTFCSCLIVASPPMAPFPLFFTIILISPVLTFPRALCSGSWNTSLDSWLVCWRGCGPLRPALCMCNPRFDPDSLASLPCPCSSCRPPACAGPCAARPSGSWGRLHPWAGPPPLHPGPGRP